MAVVKPAIDVVRLAKDLLRRTSVHRLQPALLAEGESHAAVPKLKGQIAGLHCGPRVKRCPVLRLRLSPATDVMLQRHEFRLAELRKLRHPPLATTASQYDVGESVI